MPRPQRVHIAVELVCARKIQYKGSVMMGMAIRATLQAMAPLGRTGVADGGQKP